MTDDLKARVERWAREDPDPASAKELLGLLAQGDGAELADRFHAPLAFGTAGLRGVIGAGPNRMNRAVVRRTTLGLARYLKANLPEAVTRGVVVARDGRRMSEEFARDAAQVLAAEGFKVHFFPQVAPTPVCAFAVKHLGAAAGVMVTASHNPPEYNGYKVYWANSAQIVPPHDEGIARAIDAVGAANEVPLLAWEQARASGLIDELGNQVEEAYLSAILALRRHPRPSSPLKLVYTAMHGVGGPWFLSAVERAGFKNVHVVKEQQVPDGAFPTVRFPNPEEKGAMDLSRALAERVGADVVLANDPDADRLAVLARDSQGALVALSGNEVGVLLGHYLLTQTQPAPARPLVMTTIVSSTQLRHLAEALGARYDETLTGFKWIANRAMELEAREGLDFVFGYEEALGYTVGPVVRDKDGVGAALVCADMAAWCQERGVTLLGYLEAIQRAHGLFVAEQESVTLPGAEGQASIAKIMKGFRASSPTQVGGRAVMATRDYLSRTVHSAGRTEPLSLPTSDVLAYELEGGARVTLRPSGTEPKIKFYFELKETPAPGEPLAVARGRAVEKLRALLADFRTLARARGAA
jgi:phosphomannomutase